VSGLVRFVYLLALAIWIGEIVAFSFVVAPTVFAALGTSGAGEVVGAIFPRYYAVGNLAAGVAVIGALTLMRGAQRARWWAAAALCLALGLATNLWAATVVYPEAQRLRVTLRAAGRVPDESEDFRRAHREAVGLNGAALLAGLVGLAVSSGALRH
jgi:hypothetical protein